MGNNATCKVIDIGSMDITMFDGTVRTLSKVRHVPKMMKNLISLDTVVSIIVLMFHNIDARWNIVRNFHKVL